MKTANAMETGVKPTSHTLTYTGKYENQGNQTDNDDVPAIMLAKRRIIKAKGLGEYLQHFHRNQDTFYKTRYRRIENMPPVMLVGAEQDHDK